MAAESERDAEAVGQFIERFSSVLVDTGWPRMGARVFVALLATDSGRLTAAELAETLRISPAAVSGAIRFLAQVHLVGREREPGTRKDVYRVNDDIWYEAVSRRDQVIGRYFGSLREGIDVLGPGTPAADRMADTLAFFEFFNEELASIMLRWRERKARAAAEPA